MSLLARVCARAVPLVGARALIRPRAAISVCAVSVRSFTTSMRLASPPAEVKYTTHLAGLDVVPNGRDVFIGLQKEILASIEQYNKALGFEPACNEYSRRFAEHCLKVAEEEGDDIAAIEARLWSGQIEELIEQAEHQLDSVVAMNEEIRPWEAPAEAEKAEYKRLASPSFGQSMAAFESGRPAPLTPEEQKMVDEFWKPIDDEIRADMAREAEAREQRRARKAATAKQQ